MDNVQTRKVASGLWELLKTLVAFLMLAGVILLLFPSVRERYGIPLNNTLLVGVVLATIGSLILLPQRISDLLTRSDNLGFLLFGLGLYVVFGPMLFDWLRTLTLGEMLTLFGGAIILVWGYWLIRRK